MLLFELEQRPALRKVLPNVLRLGLPLPKAAQDMPEVNEGLGIYWDAFIDLSTCRGGMGDGPIPWDRAMAYADRLEMDDEEWEDFWFIVTRMDEAWMEHQEKKRKSKNA